MNFDKKKAGKIVGILLGAVVVLGILIYIASNFVLNSATSSTSVPDSLLGYGNGISEDSVDSYSPGDSRVSTDSSDSKTESSTDSDQMVIKTAEIVITVDDIDSTVTSIKTAVSGVKGYVQNLSDSGVINDRYVYMTVRIPSDKYDTVVPLIKTFAVEVTSISEDADDVTDSVKDLQARLKNQKALEVQYLTLLNRATKVSDMLSIQQQLGYVREQIELLQSQIKYYATQTDMATISVTISKAAQAIDVAGEPWKPFGVVKEAFSALVAVAKGLGSLIIWAVVLSPIVLVPFGIIKLIKRAKRAKKAKK